ncbi:MAG: BapA prefix-like domain-containing protein, partial [Azonexus sp.]|nr:BapA prefix-like domain-containing protein [Azonexus sp.]
MPRVALQEQCLKGYQIMENPTSLRVIDKASGQTSVVDISDLHNPVNSVIELSIGPEEIARIEARSQDLVITTQSGETLVIEGFFAPDETQRNELVLEDSNGILWEGQYDSPWSEFAFAEIVVDELSSGWWLLAGGLGAATSVIPGMGGAASASTDSQPDNSAPENPPSTTAVDISSITVDTGTSSSDFVTNDDNGLTVSAKLSAPLSAGERLMYSPDNGVTWIDITSSVNGTDVSYFDAGLTSTSTIQMRVVDAAGNASPTAIQLITIDTIPPEAPVILRVDDNVGDLQGDVPITDVTDDPRPTLHGTAPADAVTINLYETNLGLVASGIPVNPDGTWTYTPESPLPDGSYSFNARAVDVAGNESGNSPDWPIGIDTTAPDAPVILRVDDNVGDLQGDVPITDVTDDSRPTLHGTAPADAVTINLYEATLGLVASGIPVNPDGTWTYTPASPLPDGSYSFNARAVDVAGNESGNSPDWPIGIDTTAPAAPTVNPTDGTVITGTAEPGSTVGVDTDGDGEPDYTAVADPNGNWSVAPVAPLADGTAVTATATDPAGNTSPPASVEVDTGLVDDVAPAVPVIGSAVDDVAPAIGGLANGASTNDTQPTLQGTAEAGSTVTIYADGAWVGTTTADNVGNWSFTLPDALAEGTYDFTTTATDATGNTSGPSEAFTLTIDTTSPNAPVIERVADNVGDLQGDVPITDVTDDTRPTLHGTAPADAVTINLYEATLGLVASGIPVNPDGTWTYTPASPLPDGSYSFNARAVDVAGNESGNSPDWPIGIDTTPPVLESAATSADGASVVLTYNEALDPANPPAASDFAITIDGTPVTPTSVTVSGSTVTLVLPTAVVNGDTVTVSYTDPTAGNDAAATQDVAGNDAATLTDSPVTNTVGDTTAPTTTVSITAITDDTGTAGDFITSDSNGLTLSATLSAPLVAGEKLMYSTDGTTWTDITTSVTDQSVSHADASLTSTTTVYMRVEDAAGNAGAADSQLITIDTTADNNANDSTVAITSVTDDTGTSATDFVTNDPTLEIRGTVDLADGNLLSVKVDSTTYTVGGGLLTVDGSGNWTLNLTGSPLSAGDHTVVATVTDVAGNTATDTKTVTIDTTAPATTVNITAITNDTGTVGDFITSDSDGLTL